MYTSIIFLSYILYLYIIYFYVHHLPITCLFLTYHLSIYLLICRHTHTCTYMQGGIFLQVAHAQPCSSSEVMGEASSEPLVYTASSIAPFTFTTVFSVRRLLKLKSQQGRQVHHPSLALHALHFGCEVDGIVCGLQHQK